MKVDRVLFVIEKWCDYNPRCGESNSLDMLVGTLRGSGLAGQIEVFHYDEIALAVGREEMERRLWRRCREFAPNLVYYTSVHAEVNPSPHFLQMLRDELGIPVAAQFYDLQGNEGYIEGFFPYLTAAVIVDAQPPAKWKDSLCKIVWGWSAMDGSLFYDRGGERDIPVSFFGTFWGPENRREFISYLKENGVEVATGGGQHVALPGSQALPKRQYAELMARSKICLNFSKWTEGSGAPGKAQIKGRVFEALMSRSLLLEERNEQTPHFFEEGRDCVGFATKEELLDKVRYYLAHDEERCRIATQGWETVRERWNGRKFWERVLCEIGALSDA